MNLPTLHRRPFPVADRTRNGEPYRIMNPRLAAIDLLREKIADRKAGLDPYDTSIFILVARPDEKVWANRALELCGIVLSTSVDTAEGGRRFRTHLADDVRVELGLDSANPPLMDDEPLASRSVDSPPEAILHVLHPPRHFEVLEGGGEERPVPIMQAAMDRAARLAALRVDCGCGAPAGMECRCTVGERLASAAANRNEVH
jgi:hypothetical protein